MDNSTNQLEIINNQDDELQQFNQDEGYGDDEEYYGAEGRGEQGNIYSESSV